VAIEGSLQDVSLADICQLLAVGRKSGCLSITDRSNFGYIYFENGRVNHASVLNRPDRLGELLVTRAAITREQLAAAMDAQQKNRGMRLGQILVSQGSLSDEQLRRYISVQIEEAVYFLFKWSQGSFHFDPGQKPDEDPSFLVDIPAESLLLEGARRIDEWSLIEKKISSLDLIFQVVRAPKPDEMASLTPGQTKILEMLDGELTVEDLFKRSGMVDFDAGKALYGLVQAGFVDKAGRKVAVEEQEDDRLAQHLKLAVAFVRSGMMEDASRELKCALELEPTNQQALFRLGVIALQEGRLAAALDSFDKIGPSAGRLYGVLRNRSLALELLGRYDEALEALKEAEKLRAGDPELALARGIVLLRKGNVKESVESLNAYRTSPNVRRPSALYYAYMVIASAMSGQLDYAVAVGREGLSRYADSGPILVNLGAVLERMGEVDAAAALYTRAAAAQPAPPQAHKNLGDLAHTRGELESARIHYEKAVKLNPRLGDDVYLKLGALAHRDGDADVARLLWRRALDLNPTNASVRASLQMLESAD
jgi:tetratricopeptide (TPR) repeat protein